MNWIMSSSTKILFYNDTQAVADPGFGQGGPNWSGGPNFEMGRFMPDFI